jgi:hypothetical protein
LAAKTSAIENSISGCSSQVQSKSIGTPKLGSIQGVIGARYLGDLKRIEPKTRQVYRKYLDELDSVDVKELAIHRRISKLNYSWRCAEASAVQAHMKQGIPLAPGMEICYVIRDARRWEVDPERTASKLKAAY